jgi:hypothetical protein
MDIWSKVVILGVGGLLAGGRPCPLRLIWTGWGTVGREITVPNLFYCSNFSYCCPPTWSRGDWQSEVTVHGSAPAPVWPFRFTMDGRSTPVWPLSGGRKGLSGGPPHKQPWFGPLGVNSTWIYLIIFLLRVVSYWFILYKVKNLQHCVNFMDVCIQNGGDSPLFGS